MIMTTFHLSTPEAYGDGLHHLTQNDDTEGVLQELLITPEELPALRAVVAPPAPFTSGLERLNGFTIIADHTDPEDRRLRTILGVREGTDGDREYVTAITRQRSENPTTWTWGHYFHTLDHGSKAFAVAVADFNNR